MATRDWNPELYARFAGLRLQPALDLLARVGRLPDGPVWDLGCGAGVVGPVLRARFADRVLAGLDASAAMLARARALGCYDRLRQEDIARWAGAAASGDDDEAPGGDDAAPALIFSNAALHWLGDHDRLLPALARRLAPGGMLALQVPNQNAAPSHRLWHELVADHFPGRFDPATAPGILPAAAYHRLLAPLGAVSVWETTYLQRLDPAPDGHPVRIFTQSTYARPVLAALTPAEAEALIAAYDRTIPAHYPPEADGAVLFPFRRLFLTLAR